MSEYPHMPVEFVAATDPRVARALRVLSAPESLTDDLAIHLLNVTNAGVSPERFVDALHMCDFVVERNSEWNLTRDIRMGLNEDLQEDWELFTAIQETLISVAEGQEIDSHIGEVPRYLRSPAGLAYHWTYLDSERGLDGYLAASLMPITGLLWLADELGREQQAYGFLPESAIELRFLRAMRLYREGDRRNAIKLLRKLTTIDECRFEVAVANHLVGRSEGRSPTHRKLAEGKLRRSLACGRELGARLHVAQVLHSLALLISANRSRADEAESLLRESISIGRQQGNMHHVAQALHSLGRILGRKKATREEAEALLRESVTIGEKENNAAHIAQASYSLGTLIAKDPNRSEEAVALLERSLALDKSLGNAQYAEQTTRALSRLGAV